MHLFNIGVCVWLYVCIFTQFQFQSFNHVSPANCLSSFFSLSQRQLRRSFQLFAYTHTRIHSLYMCSVCECVCILTANNFHLICFCCRSRCSVAVPPSPALSFSLPLFVTLSFASTVGKIVNKGKGGKTVPRARSVV